MMGRQVRSSSPSLVMEETLALPLLVSAVVTTLQWLMGGGGGQVEALLLGGGEVLHEGDGGEVLGGIGGKGQLGSESYPGPFEGEVRSSGDCVGGATGAWIRC